MGKDLLYPSRSGAPGSLNIYARNGHISPAFAHFVLNDTDRTHYYVGVLETKAPSGTTTGAAPRQYAGVAREMRRLDNGTVTQDTTFNDVIQGMTVFNPAGFVGMASAVTATTLTDSNAAAWPTSHFVGRTVYMGPAHAVITASSAVGLLTFAAGWLDAAGAAASTPSAGAYTIDGSGTPTLLATFGTSGTLKLKTRDLTTDTTPWAADLTAANYAQMWLITRIGGAGYAAMTDAGVAAIGEWRVSVCPLGNDPRLVASWGNGLEVGGPEWGITGLAAIGNAVVVGKPDGLWYYDNQTRRFENVLRHLEIVPHALNGKVTESVTGGVVYTTNDGHAYFFDGVSVTEISPFKFWPIINRDIGNSRITAVADNGDTIAMVTETAYQTTQNAVANAQGNKILVNRLTVGGTATAITANGVDGSMATGMDIGTSGDVKHIDIWCPYPFEGVVMHVTRKSNSTTTTVISDVLYSSATDTFTSDPNGFIDGTKLDTGGSLSYVAFPPSASAGVVMGKSINWGSLQQAVTYNYAAGTDVTTAMYGMRITLNALVDGTTEIDEIEVIPSRAGMPNSNGGIYGTTTNFTSRDRSGLITHVYMMKRQHTTGFIPYDQYAVYAYPGVWKMAWHTGRLGQASGAQNLGQSLILWGRYRTIGISESPTRDPIRSRYPVLKKTDTVGPGPLWDLTPDGWWGNNDEKHRLKVLNAVEIDTRYLQGADKVELFAQGDDLDIVSLGVSEGGPCWFENLNYGPFRYLHLWAGISDSVTTDENAPQLFEPVRVLYSTLDVPSGKDANTATPVAT